MNIEFHVDFEGKNKISLNIDEIPISPDMFKEVIDSIKYLVKEFRDL